MRSSGPSANSWGLDCSIARASCLADPRRALLRAALGRLMKGAEEVAAYFAANLRRVRKAAGISQEEVGRRSSLHRTEVGLLERGARVPRIDTMVKLASALDVPPDRLLEGISWTPGEIGEAKPGKFQHNPNPDPSQASRLTVRSERSKTKDAGEGPEEL